MAESDLVALPDGALDDVGVACRRQPARLGRRHGAARRHRLRRVQRRHHAALARRRARTRSDEAGTDRRDVTVAWAPGAFELPLVARAFAHAGKVDAVLCLGAVIRGDTGHYDFVAGECASGIQQVQLATGRAGRLRRPDHRHARPGAGALGARRDQQGPRSGADGYRDGPAAPERAALLSRPRPGHSSAVHRVDTARTRRPPTVDSVAANRARHRASAGDRHG